MHLGVLFGTLTDERLAHQSNGVFYLRIEDTDFKREVEGGVAEIVSRLQDYNIQYDEGVDIDGNDIGAYGPYRQSLRKEIYQTFAKYLVQQGKAYPCFCDSGRLASIREEQNTLKVTPGYYGKWTCCRDLGLPEVQSRVKSSTEFVLRIRSDVSCEISADEFVFHDELKGIITFRRLSHDEVMLKSNGIPTYHFAHVVDDHLMRTTHVVRDEAWLSSVPYHAELFGALGWEMPKFIHTAQVMKLDGTSKRKLSKRYDPEAALKFYREAGYPEDALLEYLMTLLNSNFEEWRLEYPAAHRDEFAFSVDKMGTSGALFDLLKLQDISKTIISKMTAEEVHSAYDKWSKVYDNKFHPLFARDYGYTLAILAIGRGGDKPRKDIGKWDEIKDYIDFFFDELFTIKDNFPANVSGTDIEATLKRYPDLYDQSDNQTGWFAKIRNLATELGFAAETKEYKKNPDQYKGHVGDISAVLRVAVIGRANSPDMYQVFKILGQERIANRIHAQLP